MPQSITYTSLSRQVPSYTVHSPVVNEHNLRMLKGQFQHIYNPTTRNLQIFL